MTPFLFGASVMAPFFVWQFLSEKSPYFLTSQLASPFTRLPRREFCIELA